MKIRTEMGHFWITFENGYTLSVFNGYGSHTENNFAFEKWKNIIESDDSVKTIDVNELIEVINKVNNIK